eukprot:SAG11_NODE_28488_length_321_cov_0.671171_1_plen_27_part_01
MSVDGPQPTAPIWVRFEPDGWWPDACV